LFTRRFRSQIAAYVARNDMIDIEKLSDEELDELKKTRVN
jgi:hypothetical protein